MDPSFAQVCTQLGVTGLQLLALMANAAFPAPSGGSGLSATWAAGPINAFAALWSAALAHGWKIPTAIMATAPIALWASTTPGAYYRPSGQDQLWDDFP
jgi:hypothetical protein